SARFSSTVRLRIANRMRRIGRPRAFVHADRPDASRLEHPYQFQSNHLEQGEKRDDEAGAIMRVDEELVETARLGFRQPREQLLDARLDRQLFGRQEDLRSVPGPLDDRLKRGEQAEEI